MSSQRANRDNRYATRRGVAMTAQVRQHGSSHKFNVDIIDLSMTGFRCRTVFRLTIGQTLSLIMPGLAAIEARVMWADRDFYGCAFGHGMHVAVFDHITAQYLPR